ncbi:MAG TPA: S8 family serine peptidase [Actinomycetes bacterium]|jgi:type VII secretion-associated serine protease mycosin|nr:S8 family serine peptidase [Actinomycetes bacterium]
MRRWSRAVVGATLTLLLVGVMQAPGLAADDVGLRSREWWFTAWAIQDKVWPVTRGEGVTVAVIDTGVEASMPELEGAVLPGIEFQRSQAEFKNGHFVRPPVQRAGDGRQDTDPAHSHGTNMAMLIAGQGKGRSGFLGVAPGARILPIATTNIGQISDGILYAVDHGAKVINLSVIGAAVDSGTCDATMQQAVSYAVEHDVVLVASAGNEGDGRNPPLEPPACPGVLAVGGLDANLGVYEKTQRQPYVAVAAPGVDIAGVDVHGTPITSDGTSDASALTAGAVALVRSRYPQMSAREVVQRIIASARDVASPGKDLRTGYGAVRPWQALVNKPPADAPNPVFERYGAWKAAQRKAADDRRRLATLEKLGIVAAAVVVIAIIVFALMAGRRQRRRTRTPPQAGAGQVP